MNSQAVTNAVGSAQTAAADKDEELDEYNRVPGLKVIKTNDLMRTARVFAASTSAHGFYRLNHPVRSCQIGWSLLIAGAFIGVTINLSSLIVKFQSEPTAVKISARGSRYMPPDITVCNRMMFAISKIFNTSSSRPSSNETAYEYAIAPAFRPVFDSVQKVREILGLSVKRYLLLKYGNYQLNTDLLRIEEEGIYNLPNLVIRDTYGIRFLSQFSAEPVQMLLSCTYGNLACDIHDFQPQSLPIFPSCITFSADRFKQRRPNITISSLSELRIALFTDSHHDSPQITRDLLKLPGDWFNMQSTGGAVVFVHKSGTYPTHSNQIQAPANQETVVDIRNLEYTSKSTRNYRCLSQTSQQLLQYMVLDDQALKPATFQAQLADCYVSVMQEILLNKCGFIDPTLPLSLSMADQPRRGNLSNLLRGSSASAETGPTSLIDYVYQAFKQSNSTNSLPAIIDTLLDNEICLSGARFSAASDPRNQRCLDNCLAKVYSTGVMPIVWPETPQAVGKFLQPMVQRWLRSNSYFANGTSDSEGSSANLNFIEKANWNLFQSFNQLGASVSGRNRNYLAIRFRLANPQGLDMQTEESGSYELFDLLSDLGGLLGLYVGISVLTICEVAELFLQLAVMVGMILHRRRTGTDQSDQASSRKVSVVSRKFSSQIGGQLEPDEENWFAWQLPTRRTMV